MTDIKTELMIFLLRNLEFGWATIRPVARGYQLLKRTHYQPECTR